MRVPRQAAKSAANQFSVSIYLRLAPGIPHGEALSMDVQLTGVVLAVGGDGAESGLGNTLLPLGMVNTSEAPYPRHCSAKECVWAYRQLARD